jgi:hypothetical protein
MPRKGAELSLCLRNHSKLDFVQKPPPINIVTCRLTAKYQLCKLATVQQPLLGNSCGHASPATREHATMEEAFSAVRAGAT